MIDGFVLAQDLAKNLIRNTEQIWSQVLPDTGKACEPVEDAWRRFFKEPVPVCPLWFCVIETEDGCHAVVRTYPKGRFVCVQGGFATIRVLNRKAREMTANITAHLESFDASTARKHVNGIVDTTDRDYGFEPEGEAWFEWAARLPPPKPKVSISAESHHAKVSGANQLFLKEG